MPVYQYRCLHCEKQFDKFFRIADHQSVIDCECGGEAKQIISRPMIIVKPDIRYDSPIDGRPITNERARREDLARNDCIEYEPGLRQDSDRRVKENDHRLDKMIEETVSQEIERMPSRKREALANELTRDVTIDTVRLSA